MAKQTSVKDVINEIARQPLSFSDMGASLNRTTEAYRRRSRNLAYFKQYKHLLTISDLDQSPSTPLIHESHQDNVSRHQANAPYPGNLLQDVFYVGSLTGVGKLYLHSVLDIGSRFTFGLLHSTTSPEAAIAVLQNEVLPFYHTYGMSVTTILTNHGRPFNSNEKHPYELYLALNNIQHHRTPVWQFEANAFIERLQHTLVNTFYHMMLHTPFYESINGLQHNFNAWLKDYNQELLH